MTDRPFASKTSWPRLAVLGAFVAVMAVGVVFGGDLLDFDTLHRHHESLEALVAEHYAASVVVFVAAYFVGVTFSVPGAVWMTLAGGFLFGWVATSVYVVLAATAGATAVFLLARYVFGESWRARAGPMVRRMETGFRRDAFHYLLVLRLIPVFPFWLVNLVPAFVGVRLRTYVLATLLGIVPGTVVYAGVGAGLESVFEAGGRPDLSIVWAPEVLGPLLGLAVLALLPVAYRHWKGRDPGDA